MSVLFCEGFDKYGPAGQTTPTVASLLTAGEWTATAGTIAPTIVAPLSTSGQALSAGLSSGTAGFVNKTLATNYARLIGGFRFSENLAGAGFAGGIEFSDGASVQCSVSINATAGTVSIRSGNMAGTAIATTAGSVTANSTHYLEWDITFAAAGAYQVWLDGVSVLSGTGNTRAGTANNYANAISIGTRGGTANVIVFDDFYLFDTSGTTCTAPLLNNPVVETAFPSADTSTKQWLNGAAIIGAATSTSSSTNAPGANQIFLRSFTPSANMTLNSVSCVPMATSGTAKYKAVLYAGITAGSARIAEGTEVVGATSGTTLTAPFSSGQALTSGTAYTIGFITDTSVVLQLVDATTTGSKAANTYTSNSPATLPAMTAAQGSWTIWGNCTGSAADYVSVRANPPPDDTAYIYETTVNDVEFFAFPALASSPASVACVAYKARAKRSDSGAKTLDVRCASGAADTAGTASSITPGTSYTWIGNYQPTDPATGFAWTGTAINAAYGGVKIAS